MNPPAGSESPISDRGAGRRRRGLASRRVLATAFGISLLAHVGFLVLYPGLMRPDLETFAPFLLPTSPTRPEGMRAIQLVEVDPADDPQVPEEPIRPAVEAPAPPPGPPADVPDDEVDPLVPPGPTAAERLRINLDEVRLWAPVDPSVTRLTTQQRLELELAGRLEAWNDSVRAADEARRALTDWTYTDEDGGRWGVADGKLYLGDIAVPFPFGFGTNPQALEAARYREWEWLELQRGMATGEVRDSWKARAEAIRARRDRERAQARPDTSGTFR